MNVQTREPDVVLRRGLGADGVDLGAAEAAAKVFLRALGLSCDTESTASTPARMAHAYAQLLAPRPFSATTFPNEEGYSELVLVRGVPFTSICEHHALPFIGTASLGYLPGERILGLSKLARAVELFARRPQVQERMTQQIANWLQDELQPLGAGVVLSAEHLCMRLRGVEVSGTSTVTFALVGQLRDDARSREEFLAVARQERR